MPGGRILMLVLIIGVPHILMQPSSTDKSKKKCAVEVRINSTRKTLDASTSVRKPGYIFPPETTWNQGGKSFGCVCYSRPEYDFRYHPLTPDDLENIGKNCETGFHVMEYHKLISTDVALTEPLVYSVRTPFRRTVVPLAMSYVKRRFQKCKWMSNGTVIWEKSRAKGSQSRKNSTAYATLRKNISRMYSSEMSFCDCTGDDLHIYTPMCYKSESTENATHRVKKDINRTSMFAHVGIIVSIPFLLITFIVYTSLPEMRNIHGLTLRGYVGCLLIAYISVAVVRTKNLLSEVPCLVFAYIGHFSFLASFFWLNVMCFDIWWTFGGFRSLRGSVGEPDRTKFLMYSIYAWGCASLLTGICMIMDFVPRIPRDLIRPEFGTESLCWFKTEDAKALYFYGPMGFTVFCNLFFFISTIIKIVRQQKDTAAHLDSSDSRRNHDNRQWFNLYLKLFIIMGINWMMWIFTWQFQELKDYIWYITESGNEYQGLIIFIIFICKKNIKRLLIKRFSSLPNCLSRDSPTNTRHSFTRSTNSTSIPQPE